MYTRQVLGSLIGGAVVGYIALSSGYALAVVIATGILSFLLIRWGWATTARTRYWLDRGTRGVYAERCPNCKNDRHRISGDWILRCRSCGWKPGVTGIRWVTRSVPVVQFRRTVTAGGAFVAGVALTVILMGNNLGAGPETPHPAIEFLSVSLPTSDEIALALFSVLLVIVLVFWILRPRQHYCQNCGQDLGRGDPPEACPKCGSNRFSTEDPGVGKKIRLE